MRDFTPEEKELIINTPIDESCFDLQVLKPKESFPTYLRFAEAARRASKREYLEKSGDKYFRIFVSILCPAYKVVKL